MRALGSLTIGVDDATVILDVAAVIRDPDGVPLTYCAIPSAPGVVATAVFGEHVDGDGHRDGDRSLGLRARGYQQVDRGEAVSGCRRSGFDSGGRW